MLNALWVAKTGLEAQQKNIDTITNNLANASTVSFKRSRAVFEDLLYINLGQPGAQSSQNTQLPSGFQQGLGARVVANEKLFIQGDMQQTQNDLDVSINGRGFFQIQMPDGATAYTRDGGFQLNNQGQMVNAHGYAVQPAITIPAGTSKVTISRDGVVSATVTSGSSLTTTQVGQLTLADFINPAGLQSLGQNLYTETPASGAPVVGNPDLAGMGGLAQGFYEMSNVNVAEEMVNMIQAQRAYELNSKAVTVADQMLQKLANL